ncbi:MAG: transposase [Armatimonadota bacterium]
MPRWHNQYADGCAHFCTMTVTDWQMLLDEDAVMVLYDIWNESRIKLGVKVFAYVIMPNHFHIILQAESSDSIKQFLQRTASLSTKRLKHSGGFWQERPRVIPVYSPKVLKTKIDYIHNNPIRAGLSHTPDEWQHSSFSLLYGYSKSNQRNSIFICDEINYVGF